MSRSTPRSSKKTQVGPLRKTCNNFAMQTLAYRYELRPTAEQKQAFYRFAGQCRFVYNELLRRSKDAHSSGEEYPLSAFGLCYEITKLKGEIEWLAECHTHCLQESAKRLALAYQRWFKWLKNRSGRRVGAPRFKSKRDGRQSFSYKSGIKVDGDKVWLPKIGWVRFRNSRDPIGKLKGATIRRSASGKWFVSITAERSVAPKLERTEVVGVDVGLSQFATLSTGEKIDNPRHLRRSERKLARLQRALSRKKKGSSSRAKAKQKVARLHERVANQRKDFQHKLSTKLVNENQVIGIEDLCLSGLIRTRLAKSFADAGLSEFLRQLRYKCEWYGRQLVVADRFFPSSKTCSVCGEKSELELSDRRWACGSCGTEHDRDVNAAINLKNLAAGHAESQNASGVAVRLATAS